VEKARHNSVSASALPAIAKHEKALIEKEQAAQAEARQLVDAARAEAYSIHEACNQKIAAEVAAIRRAGEEDRESERQKYQDAFERKLEAMRVDAKARAHTAIDAVIALVLPRGAR